MLYAFSCSSTPSPRPSCPASRPVQPHTQPPVNALRQVSCSRADSPQSTPCAPKQVLDGETSFCEPWQKGSCSVPLDQHALTQNCTLRRRQKDMIAYLPGYTAKARRRLHAAGRVPFLHETSELAHGAPRACRGCSVPAASGRDAVRATRRSRSASHRSFTVQPAPRSSTAPAPNSANRRASGSSPGGAASAMDQKHGQASSQVPDWAACGSMQD